MSFKASVLLGDILRSHGGGKAKENKGTKKGDKFSSTELGAKYTIAPGLTANLIYTKASHTPNMGAKNTGNSTRLQMRLNF